MQARPKVLKPSNDLTTAIFLPLTIFKRKWIAQPLLKYYISKYDTQSI